MTPFHWALAAVGGLIVLALAGLLGYTVYAMLTNRETVSGYLEDAPRAVVFFAGLAVGLAVGFLSGHWWPVVGD